MAKKKIALFFDMDTESGRQIVEFLEPFHRKKSDIVGALLMEWIAENGTCVPVQWLERGGLMKHAEMKRVETEHGKVKHVDTVHEKVERAETGYEEIRQEEVKLAEARRLDMKDRKNLKDQNEHAAEDRQMMSDSRMVTEAEPEMRFGEYETEAMEGEAVQLSVGMETDTRIQTAEQELSELSEEKNHVGTLDRSLMMAGLGAFFT